MYIALLDSKEKSKCTESSKLNLDLLKQLGYISS